MPLVLGMIAGLATGAGPQPVGGSTLVDAGRSRYAIVVGATAPPAVRRGAEELQRHVKEMCAVTLPIRTDSEGLPAHAILIGPSRHLQALHVSIDPKRLGTEGFLLRTVGPHLVIAGAGPRGTMYGCSALLEKLGVRWFTPTVTRIPHPDRISVPAMEETQVPAFEYREPFFWEAQDRDWAARNRVNGAWTRLDESTGER